MPRGKAPLTPGSQAYGEKGRLDAALNDTPGARDIASPGAGGGVPVPQAPPPGAVPPNVLAAAQSMTPPGESPFVGPSKRPDEPITAGLTSGAGPGPEALAPTRPDHVSDSLAALGDATGDPMMYELARRARLYRG